MKLHDSLLIIGLTILAISLFFCSVDINPEPDIIVVPDDIKGYKTVEEDYCICSIEDLNNDTC